MCGKKHFLKGALRTLLVFALVPLSAGCGSKGTVSGKVFFQGKPLPGGLVTFLQDKGAYHSVIQEDGSYQVSGIPPGPATITVSSPDPPPQAVQGRTAMEKTTKSAAKDYKGQIPLEEMAKHMGDPEAGKRKYMAIPPQYKDPDKSGLTYTVKSGAQAFDIQLQ